MIYLDANVIIRLMEGSNSIRRPLEARLNQYRGIQSSLHTSVLSLIECRCKAYEWNDQLLLQSYDKFFSSYEVRLLDIHPDIVQLATLLRADGHRTPDAIHLASSISSGAQVFLTGDKKLGRFTGVHVEIL